MGRAPAASGGPEASERCPVAFLTEAEKERLECFPREVPAQDLYAFFTLTGPDRAAIPARSASANRLGFALALCAVRYFGFCPGDLSAAPDDVVWYVSEQLGVPAVALRGYGERPLVPHQGRWASS